MEIRDVERSDLDEITPLVKAEFPYTQIDENKMRGKLENENIFMFAAVDNGSFLGFIEIEILEPETARINGLAVKPESRGDQVGKHLLDYGIDFLRERGIKTVKLLVKEENAGAKALYTQAGFDFVGMHPKKLDESVVEELQLSLETEAPKGVS